MYNCFIYDFFWIEQIQFTFSKGTWADLNDLQMLSFWAKQRLSKLFWKKRWMSAIKRVSL